MMTNSLVKSWLYIVIIMLCATPMLGQQDQCPSIVATTLDTANLSCTDTGRNEACYGNNTVEVSAREGFETSFDQPGDKVNLVTVDSMLLSAMNEAVGEWGVVLMRLQANLPDTLPGQNVTLLLFGDVEIENDVDHSENEGEGSTMSPMQAFYFTSGIGDAQCQEAPDSGLLIQTPEGAVDVEFVVNEVKVTLNSTAYMQAEAGSEMIIYLIEGQATVEALGVTEVVLAGTGVSIPLDEELRVSGAPSAPEPYDDETLASLPISILERDIEIAPAVTVEQANTVDEIVADLDGDWLLTWLPSEGCGEIEVTVPVSIESVADNSGLDVGGGLGPTRAFTQTEPQIYVYDDEDVTLTIQVQESNLLTIVITRVLTNLTTTCFGEITR